MMARRPIELDEANLTQEQRVVFDAIASGPRGIVEGPLRVWLQSPELAEKAQALGAFCRYGTRLPAKLSELAILVTGAFWRSGFEWAVHAPIARREGLSEALVEAIRLGKRPNFSDAAEEAVYDFASGLHRDHRVSDETYGKITELFGQEGAVELTGILGYYTLISMTINAFAVPLPEGAEEPF